MRSCFFAFLSCNANIYKGYSHERLSSSSSITSPKRTHTQKRCLDVFFWGSQVCSLKNLRQNIQENNTWLSRKKKIQKKWLYLTVAAFSSTIFSINSLGIKKYFFCKSTKIFILIHVYINLRDEALEHTFCD